MTLSIDQMTRQQLARLGREYMLAAQFNSRTGYAALAMEHGEGAYKDTAIANWMAASPVYTRRMQRALGFAGNSDVATIFKGLQLECGFSHQYFDVHFEVSANDRGRFWLDRCGALLEAEPRGEEAVRVMCHDIEDPTFDATAAATNPRARMRPVHRPPRVPADRAPHCEWNVFIDEQAEPIAEPALSRRLATTQLANLTLPPVIASDGGGLNDYSGAVMEQLHLEHFSQPALQAICRELAVQMHLLVNSLSMVIADTYGAPAAGKVAAFQMQGSCWVVSERLKRLLPVEVEGIDALLQVLAMHPALQPAQYWSPELARIDDRRAQLRLNDSPAAAEENGYGWYPVLANGDDSGLLALVQGVDRRARLQCVEGSPMLWDIYLEDTEATEDEPLSVQIAKGTVLYQTKLEDHIQVLQQG